MFVVFLLVQITERSLFGNYIDVLRLIHILRKLRTLWMEEMQADVIADADANRMVTQRQQLIRPNRDCTTVPHRKSLTSIMPIIVV